MKNGCILCGGVGSGKSRTSLAYYYKEQGGDINTPYYDYVYMKEPKDLYIITTAHKRDTLEWDEELLPFLLSQKEEFNKYNNKVVIDSWNNIKKYDKIYNAFFIFDEQRVVGSGVWVKSFLKIVKKNRWILLSATPGDTWSDYIPVFVANGFYKNKTDFLREHAVYSRFTKYPKIEKFIDTGKLLKYKLNILVDMPFERNTIRINRDVFLDYDKTKYKELGKNRWNPYTDKPIINAAELCYTWRKIINSDDSRERAVKNICSEHEKVIIFYNFDYELDILKNIEYPDGTVVKEWNGHKHEDTPTSQKWVYLVQYTAGCEGWNCISTDTIVFYSQNYSYKVMEQASGRIDRMNTPFEKLYYYHLKSKASIDLAISRAIITKRKFNENVFTKW